MLSRIVILQDLDIWIVSSSQEVFSKTQVFRKIKQKQMFSNPAKGIGFSELLRLVFPELLRSLQASPVSFSMLKISFSLILPILSQILRDISEILVIAFFEVILYNVLTKMLLHKYYFKIPSFYLSHIMLSVFFEFLRLCFLIRFVG